MEKQIAFVVSDSFRRQVTKRLWLRRYAGGYLFWLAIPFIAAVLCVVSGDMPLTGAGGALVGFLLGVAFALAALLFYSYVLMQRANAAAAQRRRGVEVRYTFDDQGFSYDSDVVSGRCSWQSIQRAQLTPEALLLIFDTTQSIALPTNLIDSDLRQFILQKVIESGGIAVR